MIRSVRSTAAYLLLVAAAAFQAVADDAPKVTYELKYQFGVGQMLEYSTENASTIYVQVGDVADTVQHSEQSGKILRVQSVDETGSALIEGRIECVKLAADHQGEHVEWDSCSGAEPPEDFRAVAETIGGPLGTIRVSSRGQVTVVSLRGVAATGDVQPGAQLDMFPVLPDAPVAVGDTWKESFDVEIMATPTLKKAVSMQRLYTLKDVTDGEATIDVRTIVLSPLRDPLEEGQLIQRTPSGTVVIDIAGGKLLSREMKIDKRVVGFQGPQTSLQVTGTRNESLTSEEKPEDASAATTETAASSQP